MHINEIVFSRSMLDSGLCVGEDDNGAPVIIDRHSPYSSGFGYGCAQLVEWVGTGVFCTRAEWNRRTNQEMTCRDVMREFGIRNTHPTPCKIEKELQNDADKLIKKIRKHYTQRLADILRSKISLSTGSDSAAFMSAAETYVDLYMDRTESPKRRCSDCLYGNERELCAACRSCADDPVNRPGYLRFRIM